MLDVYISYWHIIAVQSVLSIVVTIAVVVILFPWL